MARGQQKVQAQQKRAAKLKGPKGSQIGQAEKAMKVVCKSCMASMLDIKQYKMHWESKHSKLPLPDELKA
eukprot:m.257831 g.257831  ORF g.257831 m.257831 type:complete len:70 (-) comp35748_c0_seq1:357-566(-)